MSAQVRQFMGKTAYAQLKSTYPQINEETELREWTYPLHNTVSAYQKMGYYRVPQLIALWDVLDEQGNVKASSPIKTEVQTFTFSLWGTGNRNQFWYMTYDPANNVLWYQWT